MTRLRVAVLLVLAVALLAAPAGAADSEPKKKESRSVWDRVKDTAGDVVSGAADVADTATDWVLPGDSVLEKAGSMVTGESPISPFHAQAEAREGVTTAVKVAGEEAAKANIPGYEHFGAVSEGVRKYVPGGWRGVGLAVLFLILWLLFSSGVPKNVARSAGQTYAPRATAAVRGKKPPRQAAAKTTWSHSGRSGKADVVAARSGRLEVCADSQRAALAAAKKRWQGYRVRPAGTDDCDLNPDKVHVYVSKARAA